MAYGLKFINDDGIRVVGKNEDNLKFIGKYTSYSVSTYGNDLCYYLTFTVTSSEKPICYLYVPFDTVGSCSVGGYTNSTDCLVKGGGGWSWSGSDRRLCAIHAIVNAGGNSWNVYVKCGYRGYPSTATIYAFNLVGNTPSTDLYGIRVWKDNGTDLAYDSGYTPLMCKVGAESVSQNPGSGALVIGYNELSGGDTWADRGISKPAFGASTHDINCQAWTFFGYYYLRYYRGFFSPTPTGIAKWFCTWSAGVIGSGTDVVLGTTAPVNTGGWFYRNITIPFIDGADYD
jgi:hypothetical protein